MSKDQVIDHLFRHQHGRMVAILCRVFGLRHLETIEDAVQDTFIKAMSAWREGMPENPEAWLTKAAKNRMIDLFRSIDSEKKRAEHFESGSSAMAIDDLFLDAEVADSQLRMIFAACHPALDPRDQIAFALKTIAGFSQKEIAAALLLKEETVKKRLSRARASIRKEDIAFSIPMGQELTTRRIRVLEVLYLLFNEGFHSIKKEIIVRKELCGEAMRLCKMLVDHPVVCNPETQALLALMCFHSARLDSKIDENNEIIDLRLQDRTKWFFPLILQGNDLMFKATEEDTFSAYHYEAAIASEHLKASTFDDTDWPRINKWYERLQKISPSPFNLLNMAVVALQQDLPTEAKTILDTIKIESLEQRRYLYHGCLAQYYLKVGRDGEAISAYGRAIDLVSNESEKRYLIRKRDKITTGSEE